MSEVAIKVNDISKLYKLYDTPTDRLKESLGISKKKRYKEHYALNHVSFEVQKGETVGIIGTNGSGKSTILKIITGVLSPTGGNIEINGRVSALLELGAGFNTEYTGIENVYLNGTMIGFTKEEIDAKLDDILSFADIGDFVYQPVKTYSSGMFVRLAFAVAINIEPEILIVDEALSVGDVFFQAKCFKKFEEFKQQGKTILFVSHDTGSIQKYCDRVVLLNKGDKIMEGSPKGVVDAYKKILVHANLEDKQEKKDEDLASNNEWKTHFALNPNCVEYGEREIEIIDYAILNEDKQFTNCIEDGKSFSIKMKVKFNEKIENPIFAFTIKNVQGTEIAGTNTMYENINIGNCVPGDIKEIEFQQKSVLRSGDYLLSLGCTGYKDGEFKVYHRLYDVTNINATADKYMVGFFDLNSQIEIQ